MRSTPRSCRKAGRTATLYAAVVSALTACPQDPAEAAQPGRPPVKPWQPVGRVQDAELEECSGIVASRQFPGIFWVHNDSGHQAVLYAITETGEVVARVPVEGAPNIDWEDIATDNQGHLYVADTGNNFGVLPVRSVYQVKEPDPHSTPVEPARVVKRYKYSYAGKRFDAEGLFVRGDRLWIVSKPRGARSAIHRLDPVGGGKYQPVETAALGMSAVSAADLSPDGNRLAVCNGWMLVVFRVDQDAVPLVGEQPEVVRFPRDELEACCFDGDDVVLATESGKIYRVSAADLAAGTRFIRPKVFDSRRSR